MNEVNRVLSPNGVYICITYGDEEHRRNYFQSVNINNLIINNFFYNQKTGEWQWDISVDKVAKPSSTITNNINPDDKDPKNFHYIFVMKKGDKKQLNYFLLLM